MIPDLHALLGPGLGRAAGVLHVAAVWESAEGAYATLRVGGGAPTSASDAAVLSAARARADAIVTTAKILRDEPDLVHTSVASPDVTAELETLRRGTWGIAGPPWIAVLTLSGRLPMDHPALARAERLLFYTGAEGAARLREDPSLPPHAIVCESRTPGAVALVEHLQTERGARSISIEAGVSTAGALYEGGGRVDSLWLSVCQADHVDEVDLVGPFVSRETIEAVLGAPKHAERHLEGGVPWTTLVHQRAPGPGG